MARFIDELKRTHHCAELRASDEKKEVVLFGWVASYRDHGGCVFVDLRDREGITQLVFDPNTKGHGDAPVAAYTTAQTLRSEWVIGIRGLVVGRGSNKNARLPTGEIEVHVLELTVFNRADTPPFELADSSTPPRRSGCSTATWTSGARRCRRRCASAIASTRRRAATSTSRGSSSSRRR